MRKQRKSELELDKPRYVSAAILYIIMYIVTNMKPYQNLKLNTI